MEYKRMFIWVEGEDDIRFFNRIIKPLFQEKYNLVEVRLYASLKRKKVDNFLKSIKAMAADYIYVTDINNAQCVTRKKQKIQNKLRNTDGDRIVVVIKEIESWYLAGLSDTDSKKFKMRPFSSTEDISKKQFNNLIPKGFDSRIDFTLEILKYFSIKIAKQKNKSFRYFLQKHCEA